jgi:vesicle transport through interaction with t-SNAREs protein 1
MDNEPTTLFESYEGDFQTLITAVEEKLNGDAKEQRGGMNFIKNKR